VDEHDILISLFVVLLCRHESVEGTPDASEPVVECPSNASFRLTESFPYLPKYQSSQHRPQHPQAQLLSKAAIASNKNLSSLQVHLSILNNNSLETLGALDIHGLDVAVELLLGTLLIVTLAGDADTKTVWHTLNTGLPDLLVELGVEADVAGTLRKKHVSSYSSGFC